MSRNETSDFRAACREDYVELAARTFAEVLLLDATECEEAASYLDREGDKRDALRAKIRAEEARRVAAMPREDVCSLARKIRRKRGRVGPAPKARLTAVVRIVPVRGPRWIALVDGLLLDERDFGSREEALAFGEAKLGRRSCS